MAAAKAINRKMIGVHTLSESVFCPRAGTISHEQGNTDSGIDNGFVDLSYSPDYDIILMREELRKIVRRVENFSLGLIGGTFATIVFGLSSKPFLGFLCLIVFLSAAAFIVPRLYANVMRYRHIKKRLADYERKNKQRPNLEKHGVELIPWYSLLKGFDVEKCHDILKDKELGIQGTPWKLLHHNKVTLPVFFCRPPKAAAERSNDLTRWLQKKHFVRMRAYCHLIEKNTGQHSSCGVILFAGSLDAVAIKFWQDEAADRQLKESVAIAHETLDKFKQTGTVGVRTANPCVRCHLGFPKIYRLEEATVRKDGKPVLPKLLEKKVRGRLEKRHSVCGDFFEWTPPHDRTVELKLV